MRAACHVTLPGLLVETHAYGIANAWASHAKMPHQCPVLLLIKPERLPRWHIDELDRGCLRLRGLRAGRLLQHAGPCHTEVWHMTSHGSKMLWLPGYLVSCSLPTPQTPEAHGRNGNDTQTSTHTDKLISR